MTASPSIRFASLTDVGVRRSHNQDACVSQPASDAHNFTTLGHIFIVADGMGGHAVGEKASAKAVRDIPLTYLKHVAHEGPAVAIRRAFRETNAGIFAIGQNNPEFKGLGTTGTAIFLRPEGLWIGHVGDSRAYRVRRGRIQQLTFDHSWVWEIARRQGIDPDELGDFKRNVIIRSLGPDSEVEVDLEGPHPLEEGDRFLICSDGLSNQVTPDELGAILTAFPPQEACRYLIALANARGGPDNITALIVEVEETTEGGSPKLRSRRSWSQLMSSVNRLVPWPFLSLITGAVLAGVSIWLRSEDLPGAVYLFLFAAVLILSGLVGLYLYMRRQAELAESEEEEGDRELRLYRDYAFEIGPELVKRFADEEADIREIVKEIGEGEAQHAQLLAKAKAAADRSDWVEAFQSRFLAYQLVAEVAVASRQKDEAFQPNWTGSRKGK